ncbi:MAG: 23S rRNA (adenine(2503)-C(2))-methyltransferase RlmN, partial [Pseudomonadota bacterium]
MTTLFNLPLADETDQRASLIGLTRQDLAARFAADLGLAEKEARMRARQVWGWVYNFGATDFAAMTNISKVMREKLSDWYRIPRAEIIERLISNDGTRKYLLRFAPGVEAEAVFIPGVGRAGALCVSSQVGCTLNCTFCHTGTQALVRNLTAEEIVLQVLACKDDIDEWPSGRDDRQLTNIVFMGMGEPLYNLDSVAKSIDVISDGEGISISRRRITVSTSGIVNQMHALGSQTEAMLAISLHAVRDELRDALVPINKKWPLRDLLKACRDYPGTSNARRITFEYVMLKGINDSDAEARELVRLLQGIPAKINLIPFNPWPDSPYACS